MATKTWLTGGLMLLVVLTASVYILMPDNVKIVVENTRTKFYVWENEKWILGGTEYVNLFDGTAKMRASARSVEYETKGNITTITRNAQYKSNIFTHEVYTFDTSVTDVALVPISHEVLCMNCAGKILHFEYRDIEYNGITEEVISPQEYGHNMKVEWQDGYYYAKNTQSKYVSDKLVIRYKPTENRQSYLVRMFDPPQKPTDCKDITTTTCINITVPDYDWKYYYYDCSKPLVLNKSTTTKVPTANCWKWQEANITNKTAGHYNLIFEHEYYEIFKNQTFNWRKWVQVGSHKEEQCTNTTKCVQDGKIHYPDGSVLEVPNTFCRLDGDDICCVLENYPGQTGGDGGKYGKCYDDNRTSYYEENIITKKEKYSEKANIKLKKKIELSEVVIK